MIFETTERLFRRAVSGAPIETTRHRRRGEASVLLLCLFAPLVLSGGPAAMAAPADAPYVALPKGTEIRYTTGTCTVDRDSEAGLVCEDEGEGPLTLVGKLEADGPTGERDIPGRLASFLCVPNSSMRGQVTKVGNADLSPEAKETLQSLWPLSLGKEAAYVVDYDADRKTWAEVTLKVDRAETATVGGKAYDTLVVVADGQYRCNLGTWQDVTVDSYRRETWYAPSAGVVVRDRVTWTSGYRDGKTEEYELVELNLPAAAPAVARAAPAAAPRAAVPPVQAAVAAAVDVQGPAIEVPESLGTETPVVEITGRISDASRIVEVRLDGRPIPMDEDGSISLRRGVPEGTSALKLSAMDEWGNVSERTVTVTRVSAVAAAPKAAPAVPRPAAPVNTDRAGPVIALPDALSTTSRTVKLAGRITDDSKVVEVTVEGRPVALGPGGAIDVTRAVSVGASTIRIAAVDEWGNRTERAVAVERVRPFADIHFGRYHAIVIGNNDYGDLPDLKTAVTDAEAVAATLREEYGYEVDLLVNATRSDILGALARVRADLGPDDNLLVYYAGHGVVDTYAEEGYWMPVDAEKENPANWVSNSDITNMLRAIRAKHVLVVADSCYSGTLVRAANVELKTAQERAAWIRKMVVKRTRTAMVSGGVEPVMDAGGGEHSVFAKAFLDALRTNEDVMEGQKLFSAIKRPVALEAEQTPQYSDIRRAGHDGGDFMFVRK
jgi:hypothetical protein